MSTKSRLDKIYKTCKRIRLPEDSKILFVSDLHMGDGGPEDDFEKNDLLFQKEFLNAINRGYFIVLLGDIEDIWEAKDREKIKEGHTYLWNALLG